MPWIFLLFHRFLWIQITIEERLKVTKNSRNQYPIYIEGAQVALTSVRPVRPTTSIITRVDGETCRARTK